MVTDRRLIFGALCASPPCAQKNMSPPALVTPGVWRHDRQQALLARDQLARYAARPDRNFPETTIRCQFGHESLMVCDGSLWISRVFYVGITAPVSECPATTKLDMFNAEKSRKHYAVYSQDSVSLVQIIDELFL